MQERKGTSCHLETARASAKIADYVISRRGILREKTILASKLRTGGEGGRGRSENDEIYLMQMKEMKHGAMRKNKRI